MQQASDDPPAVQQARADPPAVQQGRPLHWQTLRSPGGAAAKAPWLPIPRSGAADGESLMTTTTTMMAMLLMMIMAMLLMMIMMIMIMRMNLIDECH